jgi:hypothetical protein
MKPLRRRLHEGCRHHIHLREGRRDHRSPPGGIHTCVCTKVADTALVRTKVADNTFVYKKVARVPLNPQGACSTFVCKRTATPLRGHLRLPRRDQRSHGGIVDHKIRPPWGRPCGRQQSPARDLAPPEATARSNPPRSPAPRPTASRSPAARSLARRWPQHRLTARRSPTSRSTTQRSPAAPSSSLKSSTASSRPRPCPTGQHGRQQVPSRGHSGGPPADACKKPDPIIYKHF